jgi:hypothetical protein
MGTKWDVIDIMSHFSFEVIIPTSTKVEKNQRKHFKRQTIALGLAEIDE